MSNEAEKPIQRSHIDREELFQLVVESSTDFAIMTTDPNGIVSSWNIGCERLIGYCEDEIIGRTADVIFVHADRIAGKAVGERATALAEGRADDERWHLRKDGSLFWASGVMMPFRNRTDGFIKIMRDRTAQRLAQERQAESEERFRTLATNIPQLVFRTRDTGARIWGSPQWEIYSGLSDTLSREFGWLDAVHPDDLQLTLELWQQARETGSYAVEHRIRRHSDGDYRWHKTLASPTPNGSGKLEEWVGTSTDIHELRGLQSRQQVLLAELQHRTRNILALVQALTRRTLRSSSSLEEFAREYGSRLLALSRVQGLVASTSKHTLGLRSLVEAELEPHCEERRNASGE